MAKVEDKNGFWFIEHNPITKTGVYDYLGKQISPECEPNKIYKVLRPKEELFKKETLDSLRLIPIVNDHTMIGTGFTAPEDKGIDGTLGDNVSHDTDTIYNDLKIMSNSMKEDIRNGKKELSLGYFCRYDKQPGTYKGQRYDYIQRDIKANHLALVDKGRMGADVRVYDSQNQGGVFAMDSIDVTFDREFNESDVNRDKNGRFATKGNGFNNTEKYGQAKHKEFEKEVEKLNSMEGIETNNGSTYTDGGFQDWTAYYKNGEHFATVNHTKREIYREKKDDSLEINGTVLLNTGFKKNTDNTYSKQYEDGTKVTVHKQKDKRVGEYHVAEIIKENGEKSLRLFMSPNTPFVIEQLKKDYKEKETQGGDMALDDEDIEWITVKGTHIPIKKGESKEQAVKKFLESKKEKDNDKEYRNKLFREATSRVEEKRKNALQNELKDIQNRQKARENEENENSSFKDKLFMEATKNVEQKRINEIQKELGGENKSENSSKIKLGDKVRFKDSQGVEYKFVGESRGMLEFENIEDDSDRKGFPKSQLEERLKDGSMQVAGGESKGNGFNNKENHKKIQDALIKRNLGKRFSNGYFTGTKYDIVENENEIKIIMKEAGKNFNDKLAESLSEELGVKVEKVRGRENIDDTIYKINKSEKSEPEKNLTEEQKESAKEVFKRVYGGNNTPFQEKKWNELYKEYYDNMSDKSIHQLYEDLKNGKFDYKDYGENSFVREEIFGRIADAEGVKYNDIYEMWLKSGEKSESGSGSKIPDNAVYLNAKKRLDNLIKGDANKEKAMKELVKIKKSIPKNNYAGREEADRKIAKKYKLDEQDVIKMYTFAETVYGQDSTDTEEYKKTQGEDSMAENKQEKPVLDEDKRKIIDEIGGILKGKVDEELWRTVIGKAEKLAYNASEAGKGTDEGEEVEEVIEEKEEKAGKDCGKKAAKDKCGKDKDEEEVEEKEDVVNKVVEKKGMDENDVIKVIARKDRLAKAVAKVIGTFDHSEMTEQQVAEYACDKLDLPVKKGEEITGINCYLKSLPKERVIFSYGMDSASKEDAEFEKFQNKGE